jgi:hypothetical protein
MDVLTRSSGKISRAVTVVYICIRLEYYKHQYQYPSRLAWFLFMPLPLDIMAE